MAKIILILCVFLVIILLRIESKRYIASGNALWIPTIWMLIVGSRSIGGWGESSVEWASAESIESGSPLDRWILLILIALGLFIVFWKKLAWSGVFRNNSVLFMVFIYLALSILWSDFPFVSFKRWFRACGSIVMALVVLTESSPAYALESIIRRCAYVLIPFSLVLVKFFSGLGRSYGRWDGQEMWTGVTTHKNSLGQLCAVSLFFLIMAIYKGWCKGHLFKSKLQTFSDLLVIAMALILLKGPPGSMSASAIGILIVGLFISFLLFRKKYLARIIVSHLHGLTIFLVSVYLLIHDAVVKIIAPIFGRDSTLTDRTEIWSILIDIASRNPLFGVGYGSFWGMDEQIISRLKVGQAHNGYLDVYLELGIIGIILLSALILDFCSKIKSAINCDYEFCLVGISFLFMSLIYNNTESSFLQTGYLWTTMLLLMVVYSAPCLQNKSKDLMNQGISHRLKQHTLPRYVLSRYKVKQK